MNVLSTDYVLAAGPVVLVGFALGVQAVSESKGRHLKNTHEVHCHCCRYSQ